MIKDYQSQVLEDTRLNKGTPTGIKEMPESTLRDSIRKMNARNKAGIAIIGQSNKLKTTREEQLKKAWPVIPWPGQ